VSLLLDALKRAEQEKLARQGPDSAPEKPALVPAPSSAASAQAARAAHRSPNLELQPIGGVAATAAPARSAPNPAAEAANAASHARAAALAPSPVKRGNALWAVAGIVLVFLVIGAAAFVWYQIEALKPPPPVARVRSNVGLLPPAAPTPAPASGVAPGGPPPLLEAPPASSTNTSAPATVSVPPAANPGKPAPASPAEDPLATLLRSQPPAGATPPVRLERTTPAASAVPGEVLAGYDALRAGDGASAKRSYEQALRMDPSNVDALLGLATLEARGGSRHAALSWYARVLTIDPRNSTALAATAVLSEFSDTRTLESHLRAAIGRSPNSAPLHFSLGNLLSSQKRWGEAQAEYFEAHRLDPSSADVLYNLAVSLDHLGQSRVAADFYRRALAAAQVGGAQFDPRSVARRLEARP
jgi:Tfp pilus assembly protein PilF